MIRDVGVRFEALAHIIRSGFSCLEIGEDEKDGKDERKMEMYSSYFKNYKTKSLMKN